MFFFFPIWNKKMFYQISICLPTYIQVAQLQSEILVTHYSQNNYILIVIVLRIIPYVEIIIIEISLHSQNLDLVSPLKSICHFIKSTISKIILFLNAVQLVNHYCHQNYTLCRNQDYPHSHNILLLLKMSFIAYIFVMHSLFTLFSTISTNFQTTTTVHLKSFCLRKIHLKALQILQSFKIKASPSLKSLKK